MAAVGADYKAITSIDALLNHIGTNHAFSKSSSGKRVLIGVLDLFAWGEDYDSRAEQENAWTVFKERVPQIVQVVSFNSTDPQPFIPIAWAPFVLSQMTTPLAAHIASLYKHSPLAQQQELSKFVKCDKVHPHELAFISKTELDADERVECNKCRYFLVSSYRCDVCDFDICADCFASCQAKEGKDDEETESDYEDEGDGDQEGDAEMSTNTKAEKKPEKKLRTSYLMYVSENHARVANENKGAAPSAIMKLVAAEWKGLSETDRAIWEGKFQEFKQAHPEAAAPAIRKSKKEKSASGAKRKRSPRTENKDDAKKGKEEKIDTDADADTAAKRRKVATSASANGNGSGSGVNAEAEAEPEGDGETDSLSSLASAAALSIASPIGGSAFSHSVSALGSQAQTQAQLRAEPQETIDVQAARLLSRAAAARSMYDLMVIKTDAARQRCDDTIMSCLIALNENTPDQSQTQSLSMSLSLSS